MSLVDLPLMLLLSPPVFVIGTILYCCYTLSLPEEEKEGTSDGYTLFLIMMETLFLFLFPEAFLFHLFITTYFHRELSNCKIMTINITYPTQPSQDESDPPIEEEDCDDECPDDCPDENIVSPEEEEEEVICPDENDVVDDGPDEDIIYSEEEEPLEIQAEKLISSTNEMCKEKVLSIKLDEHKRRVVSSLFDMLESTMHRMIRQVDTEIGTLNLAKE